MQEFEMEDRVEERILAHAKKTKRGTFYDDYENDCVELWDAIEALQEEVKRLRGMVRQLMLMNGIITKKEATT